MEMVQLSRHVSGTAVSQPLSYMQSKYVQSSGTINTPVISRKLVISSCSNKSLMPWEKHILKKLLSLIPKVCIMVFHTAYIFTRDSHNDTLWKAPRESFAPSSLSLMEVSSKSGLCTNYCSSWISQKMHRCLSAIDWLELVTFGRNFRILVLLWNS